MAEASCVTWRYATLGGAPVVVTRDEAAARDWYGRLVVEKDPGTRFFQWQCLGCGADQSTGCRGPWLPEETAQTQANKHAGECRALPPLSEVGEPSLAAELSGMRSELADVRRGLTEVAEVMRELAITVDESLLDVANAISDIPDNGEALADIATAVESLVKRPRRVWRKRLSAGRGADEELAEGDELPVGGEQ